jgi:predicted esterase
VLIAPEIKVLIYYGTGWHDTSEIDRHFVRDLLQFSDYYFPHHAQKTYAAGFSNGAYFNNLVSIMDGHFQAIIPFSGGIPDNNDAWDMIGTHMYRIMFVYGNQDSNDVKTAVDWAYDAYYNAGYDVTLHIIPNWAHSWYAEDNDYFLDFFEGI